jgi:hypothetical protein
MRLVRRLLHGEPDHEHPCPRCGVPAPVSATECTACGWDLREAYTDPLDARAPGTGDTDRVV